MLYILPDSAGDILVAQACEILSQEDYANIFLTQIKQQHKPDHQLRILLYLDHSLTDIIHTSDWHPLRFHDHCTANISRLAIVSNASWIPWYETFENENVSQFKVTEFLKALHWCDEKL